MYDEMRLTFITVTVMIKNVWQSENVSKPRLTWWKLRSIMCCLPLFFCFEKLYSLSQPFLSFFFVLPFSQVHVLLVQWPKVERQHGQSSVQAVGSWGWAAGSPGLVGREGKGEELLSLWYMGGLDLSWDHETGTSQTYRAKLKESWPSAFKHSAHFDHI